MVPCLLSGCRSTLPEIPHYSLECPGRAISTGHHEREDMLSYISYKLPRLDPKAYKDFNFTSGEPQSVTRDVSGCTSTDTNCNGVNNTSWQRTMSEQEAGLHHSAGDSNEGNRPQYRQKDSLSSERATRPQELPVWTRHVVSMAIIASFGGLIFGYGGIGQIGGFLAMQDYRNRFGNITEDVCGYAMVYAEYS